MPTDNLYEAARQIAEARAAKLQQLKAAVLAKDTPEVYRLAEILCGLRSDDDDQESDRTDTSIN